MSPNQEGDICKIHCTSSDVTIVRLTQANQHRIIVQPEELII